MGQPILTYCCSLDPNPNGQDRSDTQQLQPIKTKVTRPNQAKPNQSHSSCTAKVFTGPHHQPSKVISCSAASPEPLRHSPPHLDANVARPTRSRDEGLLRAHVLPDTCSGIANTPPAVSIYQLEQKMRKLGMQTLREDVRAALKVYAAQYTHATRAALTVYAAQTFERHCPPGQPTTATLFEVESVRMLLQATSQRSNDSGHYGPAIRKLVPLG